MRKETLPKDVRTPHGYPGTQQKMLRTVTSVERYQSVRMKMIDKKVRDIRKMTIIDDYAMYCAPGKALFMAFYI